MIEAILTKEIEVLAYACRKYYESKGYVLPLKYDKRVNKSFVPRDLKIKIKIEDLQPQSARIIEYECNKCKKIIKTSYCNYYYKRSDGLCRKCSLSVGNSGENNWARKNGIPKEVRDKISITHNKVKKIGKENKNYRHDISDAERINGRKVYENKVFVKACLLRDKFTCQSRLDKISRLQVHHIESWSKNKELRFDIDNGISLCISCHKNFHKIYGVTKRVNRGSLNEFLLTRNELQDAGRC